MPQAQHNKNQAQIKNKEGLFAVSVIHLLKLSKYMQIRAFQLASVCCDLYINATNFNILSSIFYKSTKYSKKHKFSVTQQSTYNPHILQ